MRVIHQNGLQQPSHDLHPGFACSVAKEDPMALATANICDFGWKARDFALAGVDGKTWSFADVRGPKGTLVAFICNHCAYVKAVIGRLVEEANAMREIGIGSIAVMSNDTENYPQDSFENMKVFARQHGFTFPYVIDSTQEVARAYGAQCRPDFFGFNAKDELQYRGRLDASRPTLLRGVRVLGGLASTENEPMSPARMLPTPTPAKSRLASSGWPFSEGNVLATADVCMMQTMATTSARGTSWPRSSVPVRDGSAKRGSSTDNAPSRLTPRVSRWNSTTAMPAPATPISAPGILELILTVPTVMASTPAPSPSV
jgi:peroxiredoxin